MKEQTLEDLKLEKSIIEQSLKGLSTDLNTINMKIEKHNKPKLTSEQMLGLMDVIEAAVNDYCFEPQEFSIDLSMDYDNRVEIDSVYFENQDELAHEIQKAIEDFFDEQQN